LVVYGLWFVVVTAQFSSVSLFKYFHFHLDADHMQSFVPIFFKAWGASGGHVFPWWWCYRSM